MAPDKSSDLSYALSRRRSTERAAQSLTGGSDSAPILTTNALPVDVAALLADAPETTRIPPSFVTAAPDQPAGESRACVSNQADPSGTLAIVASGRRP